MKHLPERSAGPALRGVDQRSTAGSIIVVAMFTLMPSFLPAAGRRGAGRFA